MSKQKCCGTCKWWYRPTRKYIASPQTSKIIGACMVQLPACARKATGYSRIMQARHGTSCPCYSKRKAKR